MIYININGSGKKRNLSIAKVWSHTEVTTLMCLAVTSNLRSLDFWSFRSTSTRSSLHEESLVMLVVFIFIISWSSIISWRMLSFFRCNLKVVFIPLIEAINLSERYKSGTLKPEASLFISLFRDMNSSWPLHFSPNAALEITLFVMVNKFLLRFTGSPLDKEIVSIRFHTSSSLIDLKDWTRLALRSSKTQIFLICLQ